MKNVLFTLIGFIIIAIALVSCGDMHTPTSAKMHLIKDNVDVIVSDPNIGIIDSTDIVVLYNSKYRTYGQWQIASSAINTEVYNKDTSFTYTNQLGEKVRQDYRLARIKGKL